MARALLGSPPAILVQVGSSLEFPDGEAIDARDVRSGSEVRVIGAAHEARPPVARWIRLAFLALATACGGSDALGPDLEQPAPAAATAAATTGSLRVITATSGVDKDANGYAFLVDDAMRTGIDLTDTVVVSVPSGSHTVRLNNVAANCVVTAPNKRTVSISAGGTTTTKFSVSCGTQTQPVGDIQITTATTGSSIDPDGYTYSVDLAADRPIGVNATATVDDFRAGTSSVLLQGIASNCTVSGANPVTVEIVANTTVQAAFSISCTGSGTGSIGITTQTTGSSLDPDGYTVSVDGGSGQAIGTNGTLTVPGLAPGNHSVQLAGVATNCTVGAPNPRTVAVTSGATASTTFQVTCGAAGSGSLQVTTTTTTPGVLQDPNGYNVRVDGGTAQTIGVNGSVTFAGLTAGSHAVQLGGMAGNCAVNGANPVTVTVTGGTTTAVPIGVTCGSTLKQNQIVFISTRGGATSNLYLMNDDGSNLIRLTNSGFEDQDAAVSPDGTTMVFSRIDQSGRYQIYRMTFDGSAPTNISRNSHNDSDPEWSPDGSKLVFESDRSGSPEIWFMNPDGSSPVQLTNNGGENGDVDWSPDGSRIVFESHLNGKSDIYVINTDGTGLRNLTPNSTNSYDADPNWSPDGTRVAFKSDRANPGAGTAVGTYQVYVVNADGSNLRRITQTSVTEAEPAWSPDGARLAFNSKLPGNVEVYTIKLDGTSRIRLTNNSAFDGYPEWTPPAPTTLLAQTASFAVSRGVSAAASRGPQVPKCSVDPSAPGCHRTAVIPDWQSEQ
jgi:Tol biopolymer transport system component